MSFNNKGLLVSNRVYSVMMFYCIFCFSQYTSFNDHLRPTYGLFPRSEIKDIRVNLRRWPNHRRVIPWPSAYRIRLLK